MLDYIGYLFLVLVLALFGPISSTLGSAIVCSRPHICNDTAGQEFRCVEKNMECCLNSHHQLIFYNAPRGMTCCNGDGMYHQQTHECIKTGHRGYGKIQLREGVTFCPGTEIYHNPSSQFCSIDASGKIEVLLLEDHSPASVPVESVPEAPYKCERSRVCSDSDGQEFRCLDKNWECCMNSLSQLVLSKAIRGMTCCDGDGMFREQTHKCVKGKITLREGVIVCPGTNTYFNPQTQICCTDASGKTRIHLLGDDKDDKVCCGLHYIRMSNSGCCSGNVFDRKEQCCKNQMVVSAKECPTSSTPVAVDYSRSKCRKTRVCTEKNMEKRFQNYVLGSYFMYTFEVGRFKRETATHLFYKVKECGQYIGTKKNKIRIKECSLKLVGIPKCECPGELTPGLKYSLRTRLEIKNNKMVLSGKKFYLSHKT